MKKIFNSRIFGIWIYFKIAFVVFLLQSCEPTVKQIQKNCDKYALICKPATIIHDSIIENSVTLWRDTTIVLEVPAEPVIKFVPIEPRGLAPLSDQVEIKSKFGTSKAWIDKNRLYLSFKPDTFITFYLKNALKNQIMTTYSIRSKLETSATPGNHPFDWNRFFAWLIVGIIAVFILWKLIQKYVL